MSALRPILILVLLSLFPGFVLADEIHTAAREGDLAQVRRLVDEDPTRISLADDRQCRPIHFARAFVPRRPVIVAVNASRRGSGAVIISRL